MRDEENEIERLRWEYLKRSKDYKKYCSWRRELEADPSLTEKNPEIQKYLQHSFGREELSLIKEMFPDQDNLSMLYYFHGDIFFFESFDAYWKKQKNRRHAGELLTYNKVLIEEIANAAFAILDWREERITQESLSEALRFLMCDARPDSISTSFTVRQEQFTFEEAEEFSRQIEKILKRNVPKKRFVKDELERYLKVYDMRTGNPPITFHQIYNELCPKLEFTNNAKRALINDFNKAKMIIRNIENLKLFYWQKEGDKLLYSP